MKKLLTTFIMAFLVLALLVGCGKKSTESRVEGDTFTFNAKEFKEYFNDEIFLGSKIEDFNPSKMSDGQNYLAVESIDDCTIDTISPTEDGKVTKASISFDGGEESSKGSYSSIKLTDGEVKDFKKYASKVYDTCAPNGDTKEFEAFFDRCLDTTVLRDADQEIGDLKVSFNTLSSLEFEFKPKNQQ
ncbi:MAG: hypothetical protein AB6733_17645 [Clostridiaceae bacterium]